MDDRFRLTSRRRFLAAGGASALGALGVLKRANASLTTAEGHWRYCVKCHAMFFNADDSKGSCPAGDAHQARGFEFELPFGGKETSRAQANWRRCTKCQSLFFNGYGKKGACAAGGFHAADRARNFVLPHSLPETRYDQGNWRFCNKCQVMFFDGYEQRGRCAAGGAHVGQGYVFVLHHFR